MHASLWSSQVAAHSPQTIVSCTSTQQADVWLNAMLLLWIMLRTFSLQLRWDFIIGSCDSKMMLA